ncbi:hypothetical protein NPIL_303501 [Nephila pilipes]|uniref:Uncharacterized protein n=1 Tax=Nephila pilipes TaxID=299642 RepID=A0A8X6QPI1_NEPPI|nr:hypothetical protein NPIL_303501 [Nephila pilipes]
MISDGVHDAVRWSGRRWSEGNTGRLLRMRALELRRMMKILKPSLTLLLSQPANWHLKECMYQPSSNSKTVYWLRILSCRNVLRRSVLSEIHNIGHFPHLVF